MKTQAQTMLDLHSDSDRKMLDLLLENFLNERVQLELDLLMETKAFVFPDGSKIYFCAQGCDWFIAN